MIGVIFNTLTTLIGSLMGLKLGKRIPAPLQNTLVIALGLTVLVLGMKMALGTKNFMIPMASMLIGATFGELVQLDALVTTTLTKLLKTVSGSTNNTALVDPFITASLLFCGGPMTIFGSMEAGLTGNNQTLMVKAILDGVTAIPLAASLGTGVIFGSATVLIVQSLLVILAGLLNKVLSTVVITEMTAVGGLLLIVIGLNMTKIQRELKSINLIPSLFIVPLLVKVINLFS